MTGGRRAVAIAVLVALTAAAVGGGLVLLLRDDDDTAAPSGPLGSVLTAARPASSPFGGLTEVRLAIGGDCRRIVVADGIEERATGLMRRSDLGPYDGMLFVFGGRTHGSFTMSQVPVPLDIGWYDANGRPVDQQVMRPCPDRPMSECPSYQSRGPYSYAVETLEGELPAGGISGCS